MTKALCTDATCSAVSFTSTAKLHERVCAPFTRRHRLHRGGDRDANRALHLAVVVRMRFCPRTRAYVERRTKQGQSKPEIIRCIKRYLAREVYHALVADFEALHAT